MRLISQFKAASCSQEELRGLLRQASYVAATAPRGSHAHRTALLSMKNIEAEFASRGPSR